MRGLLLLVALVLGSVQAQGVGRPLPDFAAFDGAGERVALDEYRGSPLVLNVWASWCPPCRAELPLLERAAEAIAEGGARVLLLNAGESRATAVAYLEAQEIDLRTVVDGPEGGPGTLALLDRYRVRGLPTTLFIDADGTLQARWVGELSAAALSERLALLGVSWTP